jgi:ATP-dependent RNA helicase DDX55/SPB4
MGQWKVYAYLDKTREKRRLEELSSTNIAKAEVGRKEGSTKRLEQKKKNLAWSEKVTAKEERDKRRDKKAKKRAWLKAEVGKVIQNGQVNLEDRDEEWEELAKEERLAKKRKKGVVPEADDRFVDL